MAFCRCRVLAHSLGGHAQVSSSLSTSWADREKLLLLHPFNVFTEIRDPLLNFTLVALTHLPE